jgi:hypothetical protein
MTRFATALCFSAIALAGFAGPAAYAAGSASAFSKVLAALQTADTVKVIVDLQHCHLRDGGANGPPVLGGLVINAFNVVPGKGILFADVHDTLDANGKPVTAYIRYDLAEDDQLALTVTRIPAGGKRTEDAFVCPVPDGARFLW